jgi:hypothetical protein
MNGKIARAELVEAGFGYLCGLNGVKMFSKVNEKAVRAGPKVGQERFELPPPHGDSSESPSFSVVLSLFKDAASFRAWS